MKRILAILLAILVVVSTSPFMAFAADASTAKVSIIETKLENGLIKLEFSITEATKLYGVCLDMVYDLSKLEVVTSTGAAVTVPVYSTPGFFGNGVTDHVLQDVGEDATVDWAYTALNTLKNNHISFARLLAGEAAGTTITSKSVFGELYFKVKAGQTFTTFGDFTLVDSIEALVPGKVMINLEADDQTQITPTLSQGPLNLKVELSPVDLNLDDSDLYTGALPCKLIIKRGNTTLKSLDLTVGTAAADQGSRLVFYGEKTTTPDILIGDTYYVTLAGFKSAVGTFTTEGEAGGVLDAKINIYRGNMNTDNIIDSTDFNLFSQAYGKAANSNVADFNRDGVVDVLDLYYVAKYMD